MKINKYQRKSMKINENQWKSMKNNRNHGKLYINLAIIAPQALLWECPQTVAEQVHREECRRCLISGLLMLIWMSFRDTFWELLAVTGSILGSSQWFPKPPVFRPCIRPYTFLFWVDFGATKWNFSRRNEKKDVWKSDIVLITWSRVPKSWSKKC